MIYRALIAVRVEGDTAEEAFKVAQGLVREINDQSFTDCAGILAVVPAEDPEPPTDDFDCLSEPELDEEREENMGEEIARSLGEAFARTN